jgi:hypothetical protein
MPKWTNVLVKRRHGSLLKVSGPKSAPQRMACSTEGSVQDAPDKPIAKYTRTFNAMIVHVTMGSEADATPATEAPETTAAGALAFAQSRHSVGTLDPNENPLNSLPQLGHVGI